MLTKSKQEGNGELIKELERKGLILSLEKLKVMVFERERRRTERMEVGQRKYRRGKGNEISRTFDSCQMSNIKESRRLARARTREREREEKYEGEREKEQKKERGAYESLKHDYLKIFVKTKGEHF